MKVYFIAIIVAALILETRRPCAQEESASPACMQHPSLQFGRIVTSGYFHFGRYKTSIFVCGPYYFGTTNLNCVSNLGKRGKRSAPSRYTWRLAHRFIYYDGWYFEIVEDGRYARNPLGYSRCSWERESSPAGYSSVSVDCLKRCTNRYTGRYGGYNFFWNNCHHFANRMASILYHYSSGGCPSWC